MRKFLYLHPWIECNKSDAEMAHFEAMEEIGNDHPMSGLDFKVVARRVDNDDIFVKIKNGVFKFAVIHLTWSGVVESNSLPHTSFWISRQEWADRCMCAENY